MAATVTERVVERLQRDILAGVYPPGERLPAERALSQTMEVNRNAVREALKRLEQLGLVETRHGSGTRVRDFQKLGGLETLGLVLAASPDELGAVIRDAMDFRIAYMEGFSELAAERCTAAQAAGLMRSLETLRAALDHDSWNTAERAFMDGVLGAAGNRVYSLLQNTLAQAFKQHGGMQALLFMKRGEVEQAYAELAKALSERKVPKAKAIARGLMTNERAWVLEALGLA